MLIRLPAVGVEPAEAAEEHLAADTELPVQADDVGDLEELIADRGVRERLGDGRVGDSGAVTFRGVTGKLSSQSL